MPDILHDVPIRATPAQVYAALTTPAGLDEWWTLRSSGTPVVGTTYELFFGERYDWRARVVAAEPAERFALAFTVADAEWLPTAITCALEPTSKGTMLRFAHRDWAEANESFRISAFCWAMYLRIMRRYLEYGERVAYAARLDV